MRTFTGILVLLAIFLSGIILGMVINHHRERQLFEKMKDDLPECREHKDIVFI